MEIFDIVDEEGMPTGQTVSREEAHAKGIRHRTAHIWVIRRRGPENTAAGRCEDVGAGRCEDAGAGRCEGAGAGRGEGRADAAESGQRLHYDILLQKRAMEKDSFPGRYDTSSAGHIHAGDEPRVSAIREIGEELGIRAKPQDLAYAGKFSINYREEFHGKPFLDNEVSFVYVYDRPVELKDLVLQKEEVEDAGWFDLEETLEAVRRHDPKYCVPEGGLKVLVAYLRENNAGIADIYKK